MSLLIDADLKAREVNNLGWLRHNWRMVKSFSFAESTDGSCWDLILVAHLKDGGCYLTHFMDIEVCLDFLHRPIFLGLTVRNHLPSTPGAYNLGDSFVLTNRS